MHTHQTDRSKQTSDAEGKQKQAKEQTVGKTAASSMQERAKRGASSKGGGCKGSKGKGHAVSQQRASKGKGHIASQERASEGLHAGSQQRASKGRGQGGEPEKGEAKGTMQGANRGQAKAEGARRRGE